MTVRTAVTVLALTVALTVVVAGCGSPSPSQVAGPAADGRAGSGTPASGESASPGLCVPAPSTGAAPLRGSTPPPDQTIPDQTPYQAMPDLELPCLAGGGKVAVHRLAVPTIVNLWASWCAPCRKELPAFQSFADRAGDRVLVLGVDTEDRRDAGRALVADLGIRFPVLFDDEARLRKAVGRSTLPVTLFVDTSGAVRFVYNAQALDEAAIALLVRRHLGIGVPP